MFSSLSLSLLCVQRHRSSLEWQRVYRGVPQGSLFPALCLPRGQTPVSQRNRISDSENPGWSICSLQRRGQTRSPDCWRQVSLEFVFTQIIFLFWNLWITLPVNTVLRFFSTKFPRTPWARARAKYFSSGVNKKSLDCIEKAAFFVTLDDEEQSIMGDNLGESLDHYIKSLLHGKCYNRSSCSKVAVLWTCGESCVIECICCLFVEKVVRQVFLSCFLQKWKERPKWRALLGWCTSAVTLMGGQNS